jgi:hypothetical protein
MIPQDDRTKRVLDALMGSNWQSLISQVPREVLLLVSPEAACSAQGQLISSFVFNLLIRLHPVVNHIHLQVPHGSPLFCQLPRWQGKTLLSTLRNLYESVQPPVQLTINSEILRTEMCCHITIGPGAPILTSGVWVGVDNWIARLSASGPVSINPVENPIGAYVAATMGVSEIWKRILSPLQSHIESIIISPLSGDLFFSAFDYSQGENGDNPVLPYNLDIARLTMIGLGAGGGATTFTLASLPNLVGIINLVDPDNIDLSNLNRYVFADYADAKTKRLKVECIKGLFLKSQVNIRSWGNSPYMEAKKELTDADYRLVISAVDTREARRTIQYDTPVVILDAAASERGDFFIWGMILEETECMFCKYPEKEEDPEYKQAQQFSQLLGLDASAWLRKIRDNEGFSEAEVQAFHFRLEGQKVEFDLPREGERYEDWVRNQCGRMSIPQVIGEVPIPFAPVMAGVLVAGEVIKNNLFPDQILKGYYWNNLTARFNPVIKPAQRHPRNDCRFCKDEVFKKQYHHRLKSFTAGP